MSHKYPWQKTNNILAPDCLNGHYSPPHVLVGTSLKKKPDLNHLLFLKLKRAKHKEEEEKEEEEEEEKEGGEEEEEKKEGEGGEEKKKKKE